MVRDVDGPSFVLTLYVTLTVTGLERERLFERTVNDVDGTASGKNYEIEPPEDGCVLHKRARHAPGPSSLLGLIKADPDALGAGRGLSAGHVAGIHAVNGRGDPGSRAVTGGGQAGQWGRVP